MTDIATPRSPAEGQKGTVQTAKDQARNVGQSAAEAGGGVLQSAGEQGRQVAGEARRQAGNLYGQARDEVRQQAGTQQRRAAGGLRAVGDELRSMAQQGGGSGVATDLAHRASDTVGQVADWLEAREPGQLVAEARAYARRHPGAFLAGAAVLGVLAGRLTRNLAAESGIATGNSDDRDRDFGPSTTGPGTTLAAEAGSGYTGSATYVGAAGTSYPDPAYGEPAGAGSGYADPAYPDPAGAGASPTDVVAGDPEYAGAQYTEAQYPEAQYTEAQYTDTQYGDSSGGTVYRAGAAGVTPPVGGVAEPLADPLPSQAPPSEPRHATDPNREARP
jgi:hypothetical protein